MACGCISQDFIGHVTCDLVPCMVGLHASKDLALTSWSVGIGRQEMLETCFHTAGLAPVGELSLYIATLRPSQLGPGDLITW